MTEQTEKKIENQKGQRISKAMARVGLCSRRDAEAWIEAGRVSVNGQILNSPAFNVSPSDDIRVDGERLRAPERTRIFFFHKPRGLVTTARDPEGRATIFEALPKDLPRVISIGRLDINTEGLLLLTNDGGLARILELPSTGWLRRYRVRAHGEISQARLDELSEGVTIDGVHYAGIEATLERQQGANVWLMLGLREGKNREIKRVLEHLGLFVNRLIRVSFGPFELGDLPEGAVVELSTRILRDQLGPKLAKEAGVNFDAPIGAYHGEEPAPRKRRTRPTRGDSPLLPMGGREDRAEIARELAARGERPETKMLRKRKHVSALRDEARAVDGDPRRRIARSVTRDREGREIGVERLITASTTKAAATTNHGKGKERGTRERSGQDRSDTGRFPYSEQLRNRGKSPEAGSERKERAFRYGRKPSDGVEKGQRSIQTKHISRERGSDSKQSINPSLGARPRRSGPDGKPERGRPPRRT